MARGALRNLGLLLVGGVILSLFLSPAAQADKKEDYKQERSRKRRERIRTVKKALDGTTWDITLYKSISKKRKRPIRDILTFDSGKIESKIMVSEGFSSSNFSVRIKGENIIIWETMQTSENNGLAFWKGEIEDGVMRGVLSWHVDEKTIKDHTFISEKQAAITIPKEEEVIEKTTVKPKEVKSEPKPEETFLKKEEAQMKQKEIISQEPKVKEKIKEGGKKKKKKRRGWFW